MDYDHISDMAAMQRAEAVEHEPDALQSAAHARGMRLGQELSALQECRDKQPENYSRREE